MSLTRKDKQTLYFDDNEDEEDILFDESEVQKLVDHQESPIRGPRIDIGEVSTTPILRKKKDFNGCGLTWSLNMILHVFSTAFLTYVLYKTIPGYYFFSIHPICMTIAYGFLMFEAVSFFSSWPVIGVTKKSTKVFLHWMVMVTVLILSAVGFAVVYYNKNRLGKNHFVTWHSWIGLATIICTVWVCLNGIAAKYSNELKNFQRPVIIKSIHAFAGALCFILACASLVTGLNSNYFTKLSETSWPIWYAVPPILGITVLVQVLRSFLPRLRKI